MDITMCKDIECPMKDSCYRHTAKSWELQSYFIDSPREWDKCEHFWKTKNKAFDFLLDEPDLYEDMVDTDEIKLCPHCWNWIRWDYDDEYCCECLWKLDTEWEVKSIPMKELWDMMWWAWCWDWMKYCEDNKDSWKTTDELYKDFRDLNK